MQNLDFFRFFDVIPYIKEQINEIKWFKVFFF